MKLVIAGARLVSRADALNTVGDLLIENGKIAAVGEGIEAAGADRTVDARGLVLTAGLIDLFAHASEPAGEGEDDLLSLGAAAVAGGFTGVCVHTNAKSQTEIELLRERAGYAACDLYPSVCAIADKELLPFGELKLAGAKAVYEDECVDNPLRMRDALFRAKNTGFPYWTAAVTGVCTQKALFAKARWRICWICRLFPPARKLSPLRAIWCSPGRLAPACTSGMSPLPFRWI